MDESPCGQQCGAQGVLIGQRIGCKLDRRTDFDSWTRGTAMLRLIWIRLPTLLFLPRRNGEPPGLRRRLRGFLIKKVWMWTRWSACLPEAKFGTPPSHGISHNSLAEGEKPTRESASLKRIANDIELVLHQLETMK